MRIVAKLILAAAAVWAGILVIDIFHAPAGRFTVGGATFFGFTVLYAIVFGVAAHRLNPATLVEDKTYLLRWIAAATIAGLTLLLIKPFDTSWAYWAGGVVSAAVTLVLVWGIDQVSRAMEAVDREAYAY